MRKFVLCLACAALLAAPALGADTIKVGQLAAVTGDFAAYGVAEWESVKIAVEEINKAGGVLGKPLELI